MLIDDGPMDVDLEPWTDDLSGTAFDRVPSTLTGVLQARLDALPESARQGLQNASVVGRIFWDDAVHQLGGDLSSLQPAIDREFVFERRPSSLSGCSEYVFKHAMLHEVVYETVLLEQRRALHAKAAQWLEQTSGPRRDEYLIEIARHWERGGSPERAAELIDSAAELGRRVAPRTDRSGRTGGGAGCTHPVPLRELTPVGDRRFLIRDTVAYLVRDMLLARRGVRALQTLRRIMNRRSARGAAITAVTLLMIASCSSDDDATGTTTATTDAPATSAEPTTAPDTTEPAGDLDPYAQTLEWDECDQGECATAIVPTDYDDPAAGTTTIAMARQPAAGEKIGTLFINPGGPGGSGVEFLGSFALLVSPEVSDAYDIVGFDPRGVGSSDPLGCLDTEGLDTLLSTDVDPDDPASVDALTTLIEGQAEACLSTNPELTKHVTTVETAKDLDVLRALVGDDQLHYYGASYGTFLGSTYAALFPERAGRLVLDGAMDPSLSSAQTALRQAGGFQLAFDDYAADCVANTCELGASVDEIEQRVSDLLEATQDTPLPTDDPDRPLTQAYAFYGIAEPLYTQEQWPVLTAALLEAFDGDGTTLLASADEYNQRTADGYATNLQQANTAINGLDCKIAPEADSTPTEDDFLAASPLFGAILFGYVEVGCDAWPITPTVEAPDYTAQGAAPILVVGTTGDPATPLASAQKLAELLDSGVLLIRDGEGHTAYFSGDECITTIIDAFLVDGTVPEDGTECGAPAESTTTTTAASTAAPSGPTTTVAASVPSGTVTLTVAGDDAFTGDITSCTLVEPDVTFTARSETAEMEVGTQADGDVFVTVTGVYEFEGTGTAAFGPDTGIDQGGVTITGSGAQLDDGAPIEDFVLTAEIGAC